MKTHPNKKRVLREINRAVVNAIFGVDSKTMAARYLIIENRLHIKKWQKIRNK